MKKIGIEVEFFGTTKDNNLLDLSNFGIPHDEYPVLAEARGAAFEDVFQAVGSVKGEIARIVHLMGEKQITPVFESWMKRDDKLEEKILRKGLTKHIAYQNLYAKSVSRKNKRFYAAGMHVSFTKERNITRSDNTTITVNELFDFPILFDKITQEFLKEIKDSERVEGFYEVKSDGRVEYRSLPSSLIFADNFPARLMKCLK